MKWLFPNNPTAALSAKLGVTVVGMFVFAVWIMPPLYDAFCEVTGLNGKTGGRYEATDSGIDTSRTIKVQFVSTNNEGMPWEFKPAVRTVTVHPGEQKRIDYLARNPTDKDMVGQAIPSLVPFKATNYFHKTECFCFEQQPLEAGASAELPMFFIVDRDIPKHINTITLSYTLFDVTDRFGDDHNDLASLKQ
ncbi:cytochrome c oxidase assembly protein [Marinimicrobium sp. LS-A18]|uniref:cytochrome c oxidase assembly protein n=1 Tax=Marinimicrobium sp. LS-A18 TaxID=1381596 RepID=UPI000467C3DA|nr:cytochrome c oxidase assembly protein [Marinimicrobium sp. LS-A18]